MERFLVVLGGRRLEPERMLAWAQSADRILAVDAGIYHLESVGVTPQVASGDFDSSDPQHLPEAVERLDMPDQERTDFEKALAWCEHNDIERIHVMCAEGDLPDHQLYNLYAAANTLLDVWFVFERGLGRIVKPEHGAVTINGTPGQRISLIPLQACESVSFTGVQWPLERATLVPLGSASISNAFASEQASVSIERGVAFLFWETNDVIWE